MSNLSDFTGSSGIKPPLPALNNSMGIPLTAEFQFGNFLPMQITNEGEYLEIVDTSIEHFDELSVSIWTAAATDLDASADKLTALYWDKVDDRLYMLTYDTVAEEAAFGWVNTLTGAVTALGSVFTSLELDAAPEMSQVSMTRAVQGTGNFQVSLANDNGQAYIEIPPAGGSQENVISNILLGNVEPKMLAPYKIDDTLYIDNIRSADVAGISNITNTYLGPSTLAIATDKGQIQYAQIVFDGGTLLGGHIISNGAATDLNIRDWGGDVALYSTTTLTGRNNVALFDKTDFHRMAKEVAIANGLRSIQ